MKVTVVNIRSETNSQAERAGVAIHASCIIEGTLYGKPSVQYMPNNSSDYWTLDSGNDWKMFFTEKEPRSFEVRHRYQIDDPKRVNEYSAVNEAVKSLAGWLAYVYDGKVEVDMKG